MTGAGATPAGAYDGVRLLAYPSGTELAFVGHYLVAGPTPAVRAAIDAARGRARSLAARPRLRARRGRRAGEPRARRLPARRRDPRSCSPRGPAWPGRSPALLDQPALQGAAISISPTAGPAHGCSSTARPRRRGQRAAHVVHAHAPVGAALGLDADARRRRPRPRRAGAAARRRHRGLRRQRRAAARPARAARWPPRASTSHTVVSLFDGETAVAISPGPTPALLIVARVRERGRDAERAGGARGPGHARCSRPRARPAARSPSWPTGRSAAPPRTSCGLGPGLQLDYAVFDGLVVVSTSVAAIDGVAQRSALARRTTRPTARRCRIGPTRSPRYSLATSASSSARRADRV